jgi:hypothetical protein
MSLKSRLTFVALWVLSIVVVGVLVSAQTPREVVPPTPATPGPVISGADLGFRPDGWKGKARTGTFVVRINGEWVEVVDSPAIRSIPLVR